MKKMNFTIIIFLLFFYAFSPVYADDIEEEITQDFAIPTITNYIKEPSINARHAIVIERTTNSILYGKKENERCKMASTTKIMTAIIVIENGNLNETVEISSRAAGTGGSRLGVKKGDKITVSDLLYGLLLCSGNDAAVALAENVSGSVEKFAEIMNQKAKELNLKDTNFVTPHGLDNEDHYTTPYELACIANYALTNKKFLEIVSTTNYTIILNGYSKSLHNTNELLGYLNGVYGVKTGFTNGANRCLVTTIKRNNLDIICVVLGCDTKKDRTRDSIALIEYIYNCYEMKNIREVIENEFESWKKVNSNKFSVIKGKNNNLDFIMDKILYEYYPIRKNSEKNIVLNIDANYELTAPVDEMTIIGYIEVIYEKKEILKVMICSSNRIEKKNVKSYLKEFLQNYISYFNIQ